LLVENPLFFLYLLQFGSICSKERVSPKSRSVVNTYISYSDLKRSTKFTTERIGPPALKAGENQSENIRILVLIIFRNVRYQFFARGQIKEKKTRMK